MKVYVMFYKLGEEAVMSKIFLRKELAEKVVDGLNNETDGEWWYETKVVIQ